MRVLPRGFTLLAVLLAAADLEAQTVTVHLGLASASILDRGDHPVFGERNSYLTGGANLIIPVAGMIAFRTGAIYSPRSARWSGTVAELDLEIEWSPGYIEVPAMIQVGSSRLHGLVGATIGVKAHCYSTSLERGAHKSSAHSGDCPLEDFWFFTVGVSAGAGLALGRVSLEAIYNQGLTEIAHDFGSSNVWWLTVGIPVWAW